MTDKEQKKGAEDKKLSVQCKYLCGRKHVDMQRLFNILLSNKPKIKLYIE
jgi:hypothetical protein